MRKKATYALAFVLAFSAAGVAEPPGPEASPQAGTRIAGRYMEFRTADVYTGPCFANGQVGLTGQEAVLGWQVERGAWNGVALDGMAVVAVVRANVTLGDPYAAPSRFAGARAVFLVDERASPAQRAALVAFAQAQAPGLLDRVVATDAAPIRFEVDVAGRHGASRLEAGEAVRLATRPVSSEDHFCSNEEIYYPPLAENLHHAMPVVARHCSYSGNHLGGTWQDNGRRGAFVGTFAL